MRFNPRWLKGKTIRDVSLRAFEARPERDHSKAYDPIIRFTDGSYIVFVVQETEVGCYGVCPVYIKG